MSIQLEKVSKRFTKGRQTVEALADTDLEIRKGELVSLIGPSGCGKSTILNMIAGFQAPSSGSVLCSGERVDGLNIGVGYMTQHDTLIPWKTASKNIAVGLETRRGRTKRDRISDRDVVREFIQRVRLEGFEEHYPSELSGGMRQRVALARTIVPRPEILLMDEPFGALDAFTRLTLQREFLSIWEETKPTVVFVTHDLNEAMLLSDRILVMSGRNPGAITAEMKVPFRRPRDIVGLPGLPGYGKLFNELASMMGLGVSGVSENEAG